VNGIIENTDRHRRRFPTYFIKWYHQNVNAEQWHRRMVSLPERNITKDISTEWKTRDVSLFVSHKCESYQNIAVSYHEEPTTMSSGTVITTNISQPVRNTNHVTVDSRVISHGFQQDCICITTESFSLRMAEM
jgi:hypothetical protein